MNLPFSTNPALQTAPVGAPDNNAGESLRRKNRTRRNALFGAIFLILLFVGIGSVVFLSQLNQDVRQQASEGTYSSGGPSVRPIGPTGGEAIAGTQGTQCQEGKDRSVCGEGSGCGAGQQRLCMSNGQLGGCVQSDACAAQVQQVQPGVTSCNGLTRLSTGEGSRGAFVGCSGTLNCFCNSSPDYFDASRGEVLRGGGTVVCLEDLASDSCAAPGLNQPAQPTPIAAVPTPTPSVGQEQQNNPTPTPQDNPQPTPNPTPNPTPVPACNSACVTSADCPASMTCSSGACRNPSCVSSATCGCTTTTPSPTPTPVPACNSVCSADSQCPSSMICAGGFCRNPQCTGAASCGCATPTPTPSPTPTPTPSPTPTPAPYCNSTCTSNAGCPNGMTCSNGACRNPQCTGESDCLCATPTPTPSPTPSPTPTPPPYCGSTCSANSQCPSSMICVSGSCRNVLCTESSNCICATPTPAPGATVTPRPTSLPQAGSAMQTVAMVVFGTGLLGFGLAYWQRRRSL